MIEPAPRIREVIVRGIAAIKRAPGPNYAPDSVRFFCTDPGYLADWFDELHDIPEQPLIDSFKHHIDRCQDSKVWSPNPEMIARTALGDTEYYQRYRRRKRDREA